MTFVHFCSIIILCFDGDLLPFPGRWRSPNSLRSVSRRTWAWQLSGALDMAWSSWFLDKPRQLYRHGLDSLESSMVRSTRQLVGDTAVLPSTACYFHRWILVLSNPSIQMFTASPVLVPDISGYFGIFLCGFISKELWLQLFLRLERSWRADAKGSTELSWEWASWWTPCFDGAVSGHPAWYIVIHRYTM